MSWYHLAACQDEDPEMFFPIGATGPALRQLMNAKRVCARCPVQSECLRWALTTGIEHGVWGGMSEDERRAIKQQTARRRRPLRLGVRSGDRQ
jgi:WhiB family transcriptional regulator, redox-sensing transcriptional regulator